MKKMIIFIYSILYKLVHICLKHVSIHESIIWRLKIMIASDCRLVLDKSSIKRTTINVNGHANVVTINGTIMDKSEIRINGTSNVVMIDSDCDIRDTVIVVNGNNCRITIGKSTTVGSMYMVCMGKGNYITIGQDCMIADNVDVWATDSHPIFSENGEIRNPSKPIEIGNHVWIGKCAKVLKGAKIHDNAIVGMNALVTKEVPSNVVYVGENGGVIKSNVNWDRMFIAE